MSARNGRAFLFVLAAFVLSAPSEVYAVGKTSLDLSRDSIIHIVTQIQRADYKGDRPSLKRLHDELTASTNPRLQKTWKRISRSRSPISKTPLPGTLHSWNRRLAQALVWAT
jgi:hypothetical protein